MNTEKNRNIVLDFCKHLSACNVDAMFELFSDKGSWQMVGRNDKFPFGGIYDRDAAYNQLATFLSAFDTFEFNVTGVTAEKDRVAIQATSTGKGPGNKQYKNRYIMQYCLDNGKIISIDEFFDPFEVFAYIEMAE